MESCEQYEVLISAGDVGAAEAHLAGCAPCQAWRAATEQVHRLASLPPPSSEEQEALRQAAARAGAVFRASSRPRRWFRARVAAVAVAAACSFVAMLNVSSWTGGTTAAPPSGDPLESMDIAEWALMDPLDDESADDLAEELGLDLEETEQTP
jgi:hypothetical protein